MPSLRDTEFSWVFTSFHQFSFHQSELASGNWIEKSQGCEFVPHLQSPRGCPGCQSAASSGWVLALPSTLALQKWYNIPCIYIYMYRYTHLYIARSKQITLEQHQSFEVPRASEEVVTLLNQLPHGLTWNDSFLRQRQPVADHPVNWSDMLWHHTSKQIFGWSYTATWHDVGPVCSNGGRAGESSHVEDGCGVLFGQQLGGGL